MSEPFIDAGIFIDWVWNLREERDALRAQVSTLQSDANSWQSGYDKGRHDGAKHRQDEVKQLKAENELLRHGVKGDFDLDAWLDWSKEAAKLRAENEALRKQIDDMSPFKGAPLTGPDLKCLACGGYHYGMSGLPCPKMAPTAGAAMSKGEQA